MHKSNYYSLSKIAKLLGEVPVEFIARHEQNLADNDNKFIRLESEKLRCGFPMLASSNTIARLADLVVPTQFVKCSLFKDYEFLIGELQDSSLIVPFNIPINNKYLVLTAQAVPVENTNFSVTIDTKVENIGVLNIYYLEDFIKYFAVISD